VLERYDDAIIDGPSKAGVGIRHFEARENRTNGGVNIGFWVVRVDGSETDFSFISAIRERAKSEAEQFSDACREAAFEIVQEAKVGFFDKHGDTKGLVPCEVTGEPVYIEDARLDYAGTGFQDIVWGFRTVQRWTETIPPGIISPPSDTQTMTFFIDVPCRVAFQQYHRQTARMRMVAKSVRRGMLLASRAKAIVRPVALGPRP
jgi:hypothetical protein